MTVCAQYFSLTLCFCHYLQNNLHISKQGAINFFNGMEISGKLALDVLVQKQVCGIENNDYIVKTAMTRKFMNYRCFQALKLLKIPLQEAFETIVDVVATPEIDLTPVLAIAKRNKMIYTVQGCVALESKNTHRGSCMLDGRCAVGLINL